MCVHWRKKKGYVRLHGNRFRSIEIVSSEPNSTSHVVSIPILGEIPAGTPEKKEENRADTIAVDKTILGNCKEYRLFALKIAGESMMGRSMCNGDWVIADSDASPNEGEVVVALTDGDNTLKTLDRRDKRFFFKAENPDHLDWTSMEEMIIQEVVKALLRRI